MFERIDFGSDVSVYQQIKNLVQFAIAAGALEGGDPLPSVMKFAERLGVNQNTIAKAYRDLVMVGHVKGMRGQGHVVEEGVRAACREQCWERIIARLYEAAGEARAAGLPQKTVNEVVRAAHGSETGPYGPAPESVLALAVKEGASKRGA